MEFYIVEDEKVRKFLKLMGSSKLPATSRAVRVAANTIQTTWIKTIQKSNAKEGWKPSYIKAVGIDYDGGLEAEVSAEKNKFVNFIENGVKRFDMKPGIINGPKSRLGKNGRYNIIFMRKKTPGSRGANLMTVQQYKEVKQLSKKETARRYNVIGIGGDLQLKTKTVKKRQMSKAGDYAGLKKIGGENHTRYGTFRIVSEKSTGWIYPGSPKVNIYEMTGREVKPKIKEILQKGFMTDLTAREQ